MRANAAVLTAPGRSVLHLALTLACLLLCASAAPARAQGGTDPDTLLLLRFENTLTGEEGETPNFTTGTTFVPGIVGQAAFFDRSDILQYAAAGNINAAEGTIEFWVKQPATDTFPGERTFFAWGFTDGLRVYRDSSARIRFVIKENDSEAGQGLTQFWQGDVWHHIAVTWKVPGRLITYVDGVEFVNHAAGAGDVISAPPEFIYIGPRLAGVATNATIDELRVSRVARTAEEIRARYEALVHVNSLTLGVVTRTLWKTWRITPTVTANTSVGVSEMPPSAISWSSSNPGVATVNAQGQIVGVGGGTAVITASHHGAQATLPVTVKAPAREVRFNPVSSSLSTPAPGALYDVPVVILRYLPTADGQNLDVSWAPGFWSLDPIRLDELERRLDLYDPLMKFMLEEGSRFRGYGSQAVAPSLGYRVVAVITVYEPTPPGKITRFKQDPKTGLNLAMYDADWFQVFERFGLRDYVNSQGVKEVWTYWGGVQPEIPSYDPAIHPPENMREGWESNMASPTTGDVSNSNRNETDLPLYDRTYVLYGRNIRRLDPGTIHVDGHQLEQMLSHANRRQAGDDTFFWQKFVGQAGGTFARGRAGDTHHPPNANGDYDYHNYQTFESDIMDWRPDGGQTRPYSAATAGNVPYNFPNDYLSSNGGPMAEPHWYVFWRQSMPGRGNSIPFGANRMTNWWQFVGDWDASMRAGIGLYEPASCTYTLSPGSQSFAAAGGAGSLQVAAGAGCAWMASSNAPWVRLTSGDASTGGAGVVAFNVAPNTTPFARATTITAAGQTFALTQAPAPPVLLAEEGTATTGGVALDSVTFVRDPFSVFTPHNFSADGRRRLALFATSVELLPGESAGAVTAEAEDAAHRVFPVPVEFVGKVPGFDWLTQVNVALPAELSNAGDVQIRIILRGTPSNQVTLRIVPPQ